MFCRLVLYFKRKEEKTFYLDIPKYIMYNDRVLEEYVKKMTRCMRPTDVELYINSQPKVLFKEFSHG